MNVETKELESREVQLTVEVEPERANKAKRAVARKLSGKINIPGFRRGKAPFPVLARYLGKGALLDEVLEALGSRVFEEAVESVELEVGGPGELVDAEFNPLKLIFNVPLRPQVDLGAYRAIRIDSEEVEVTQEAVQAALRDMQEQRALLEPVERPAALGDVVTLDVLGVIGAGDDAVELIDDKNVELLLGDDRERPIPGFDEHIVGMQTDETLTFARAFPQDYANASLAGQEVRFTVTCQGIKSKTLPELDDDFAAMVGEEYETLLDLRVAIRDSLQRVAEARRDEEYRNKVVEAVVSQATIQYAPSVLRHQVDELLEEQKRLVRKRGVKWEDYLRLQSKTEDDVRAELEPQGEEQLKLGLVFGKVVEAENIDISEEEIEASIDRTASAYGKSADEIRKAFSTESGRHSVRADLLAGEAVERLVAIAKGEAPALAAVMEIQNH